jgi:hypothetical protein
VHYSPVHIELNQKDCGQSNCPDFESADNFQANVFGLKSRTTSLGTWHGFKETEFDHLRTPRR